MPNDNKEFFARQSALHPVTAPVAPPPTTNMGDTRAGIATGVSQLADSATGEVQSGLGRLLGNDKMRAAGEQRIAEGSQFQQQAAEGRVTQPTDVRSVGEAADVFQYALGQQLPRLAAVATGATAGAVAGGKLGGFAGPTGRRIGAIAGGTLGALGVNLPTMYSDARNEQREVGVDDPMGALRVGLASAASETLSDAALLGTGILMKKAGFTATNRLMAGLAAAGVNIPIQAGTEALQEELLIRERARIDPTYDVGGEEANLRRINAAILGAVLGPTIAGVAGAATHSSATPRDEDVGDGVELPPGQDIPAVAPVGGVAPTDGEFAAATDVTPPAGMTSGEAPVTDIPTEATPQPVDAVAPESTPTDAELMAAMGIPPEQPPVAVAPTQESIPQGTLPQSEVGGTPTTNAAPVIDLPAGTAIDAVAPVRGEPVAVPSVDTPKADTDTTPVATQPETTPVVTAPDPTTPVAKASDIEIAPLDGEPVTWSSPAGTRQVIGTTPTGDVVVDTAGGDRVVVPAAEMKGVIDADLAATPPTSKAPVTEVVDARAQQAEAVSPEAATAAQEAIPADVPVTPETLAAVTPEDKPDVAFMARESVAADNGRGSPVWEAAKAKGLDMTTGARMKRAKELGFTNDVFHGTSGDITEFRGGITYTSSSSETASNFAMFKGTSNKANVVPAKIRGNYLEVPADYGRETVREAEQRFARDTLGLKDSDYPNGMEIYDYARESGYDGVVFKGVVDDPGGPNIARPSDIYATLDPANIRSVNAAFDPDNVSSADIRFAQGTPTPLGLTAEQVSNEAAAISASWVNAPPINTVQTAAELPPIVAQYAKDAGIDPAGVFWQGQAYLVADNISGRDGVRSTLVHEVLGHGGLRLMFGRDFNTFAAKVAQDMKGNKHFDAFTKAHKFDMTNADERVTAADEYLAHIAQRIDEGTATERMRGTWARMVSWVNNQLRAMGFNVKLSSSDLHDLMLTSRHRIMSGPVGEAKPTMVVDGSVVKPSFMARGEDATRSLNGFARAFANIRESGLSLRAIASDLLPAVLKMTSRQDMTINFKYLFQSGPENLMDTYVNMDREQSALTDKYMVGADKVYNSMRKLGKAQRAASFATMEHATLRGLKAGLPVEKQPWTKEQWEESGNLAEYGSIESSVATLNKLWEAMDDKSRQIYIDAIRPGGVNSMHTMFNNIVQALEANIIDSMGEGEARDAALKNVRAVKQRLKGDYVPLSRFGEYVVVSYKNDENGVPQRFARNQFATSTQAAMFKAKQERTGLYSDVVPFTMTKYLKQTDGIGNAGFINDFERALNKKMLEGLDPATDGDAIGVANDYISDVMDITRQFYYEQQPDNSILKFQQHREGIRGYATDFDRSYAEYMMKHARTLGTLRYGLRKGEVLKNMRRFLNENNEGGADTPPNYDGVRAGIVYNSIIERENVLRTTKTAPIVQALGKYTFFQMLTSPSQYIVQTSQVPMFWLPTIAARPGVGFGRASKEMMKAIRSVTTGQYDEASIQSKDMDKYTEELFQKVTPDNFGQYPNKRLWDNIYTDAELDAKIAALPQQTQELLALRIMADRGVLDITRSHDLQRGASDDFGLAKTETGHAINRMVDMSGFIMRHTELSNRRVAILGTLRINQESGQGFMASLRDAEDTTLKTQFDYSRANKSPWLTNDWMKVFTQIQSFRFYSMGFMLTEFNKAFISKAATAAEKSEARKVLGYMMVTTSMYAGVVGTPLMYFAVGLTNAIMSTDDEPYDAEHEADMFFRDFGPAGETFSTLAMKGVPALLGIDISKRTELASVFQSSILNAPEGLTGNRLMEWSAGQLLGPSWTNVSNIITGSEAIGNGEYTEALKKFSPAILRDLVKTYDAAMNGIRGGGDMMLLSPEQIGYTDYILMAVGLQPTRLQEMRDTDRAILDRNTVMSQRRSKLINTYERALSENDEVGLTEAEEAIYEFNTRQPIFGIGRSDLFSAARRRVKQDMGVQTKRYLQVAEQYGKNHKPYPNQQ